jgi:hypothetical protein
MLNKPSLLIGGILISSICFSQKVSPKDLLGTWSINDTIGIHKNFRMLLNFSNDSIFYSYINNELVINCQYKINSEDDSTVLLLKGSGDNWSDSYKHSLLIKHDTLKIIPFYFVLKPEYNYNLGDIFYFIKIK